MKKLLKKIKRFLRKRTHPTIEKELTATPFVSAPMHMCLKPRDSK